MPDVELARTPTGTVTHLSYSSIDAFIKCGQKWKFKYIDHLPSPSSSALAFGTAMHSTVEEMIRNRAIPNQAFVPAPSALLERNAKAEFAKLGPDAEWGKKETVDSLIQRGKEILEDDDVLSVINAIEASFVNEKVAIELPITLYVPGVPVPIIGFIDVRNVEGIPYDFKTAGKAWDETQASEEFQSLFYLAALDQQKRPSPGNTMRHVVFPKAGPKHIQVFEHQHDAAEIEWLFLTVREYWKAIHAQIFAPNPGACFAYGRKCNFWDLCRGKK